MAYSYQPGVNLKCGFIFAVSVYIHLYVYLDARYVSPKQNSLDCCRFSYIHIFAFTKFSISKSETFCFWFQFFSPALGVLRLFWLGIWQRTRRKRHIPAAHVRPFADNGSDDAGDSQSQNRSTIGETVSCLSPSLLLLMPPSLGPRAL